MKIIKNNKVKQGWIEINFDNNEVHINETNILTSNEVEVLSKLLQANDYE